MITSQKSTGERGRKAGAGKLARTRSLALFAAVALAGLAVAGCSDSSTNPSTDYSAKGLVLQVSAADSVVDSSGVHGKLEITTGSSTSDFNILFINTSDSKRSVPSGSGYTTVWTVADPTVASIDPSSTWVFKVTGKKAGSTTATLKLMNGSNVVFTSSAIPVTVNAPVMGMRVGDTATFSYVDRDSNNAKMAGSEKTKVWTVLSAGVSIYGKTDVTEILETTYDVGGTTELERDTIYQQMASDGSIYQYDMLRALLVRVSGGDAFSSSLPAYWVKITNTSTASASSWSSIGVDSILVPNVTAPGIPAAMNVVFRMTAAHQGTQAVTVPAGSYPAAVATNHTLRLNIKLASLPITVLNDSLLFTSNAAASDGILRETFQGKVLVASAATVTQSLPVTGFEMELKSIKRKP